MHCQCFMISGTKGYRFPAQRISIQRTVHPTRMVWPGNPTMETFAGLTRQVAENGVSAVETGPIGLVPTGVRSLRTEVGRAQAGGR